MADRSLKLGQPAFQTRTPALELGQPPRLSQPDPQRATDPVVSLRGYGVAWALVFWKKGRRQTIRGGTGRSVRKQGSAEAMRSSPSPACRTFPPMRA